MTTLYRSIAAKATIDRCRENGIALVANGTGIHAIPVSVANKRPGLIACVVRYQPEIMVLLDRLVE